MSWRWLLSYRPNYFDYFNRQDFWLKNKPQSNLFWSYDSRDIQIHTLKLKYQLFLCRELKLHFDTNYNQPRCNCDHTFRGLEIRVGSGRRNWDFFFTLLAFCFVKWLSCLAPHNRLQTGLLITIASFLITF